MSRGMTPEDILQKKKQFNYLLTARGMQQVDIAKQLNVTQKTLSKWKKEMQLAEPWQSASDKKKVDKIHENIPAFLAFMKLKAPDIYSRSNELFKQFLKPY